MLIRFCLMTMGHFGKVNISIVSFYGEKVLNSAESLVFSSLCFSFWGLTL